MQDNDGLSPKSDVSSSIYERIVAECKRIYHAQRRPNGVRMNDATIDKLVAQEDRRVRIGRTSGGVKVMSLETPFGALRVLKDKYMPDDKFTITVSIPPLSRDVTRLYYDWSDELSAE